MKNNKKFMAVVASIAIITSQLLPIGSVIGYAQTNDIKNTSLETTASTLSNNEITLKGVNCQEGVHQFKIKFDTTEMKIKITDVIGKGYTGKHAFHQYFGNNEYIRLTLYNENGEVKKSVSLKGNDNVSVIIKEFDNLKFKYGDYLKLYHAEADWRATITGDVIGKTSSDFDKRVSKEVLDKYIFQLTQSGLKQVQNYYSNEITLSGKGNNIFKVLFNTITKEIEVKSVSGRNCKINDSYAGKEYIKLEVVDNNGKSLKVVTLNGDDLVSKAEELNGFKFKYGYGLRISHAEAGSHVKISGEIINLPVSFKTGVDKEILEKATFLFTSKGLEYRESRTYQNEITLKGVGCTEGVHQFTMKFNTRDMKIKIANVVGQGYTGKHPFHRFFGDNEYIKLTLYSKDRKVKKSVSLKGNDNVKVIIDAFNNQNFEYGDILKIYHAEAGWRATISGYVNDQVKYGLYDLDKGISKDVLREYSFKITNNGLQFIKDTNK